MNEKKIYSEKVIITWVSPKKTHCEALTKDGKTVLLLDKSSKFTKDLIQGKEIVCEFKNSEFGNYSFLS